MIEEISMKTPLKTKALLRSAGVGLLLLGTAWLAQAAVTIIKADGSICTDGTINVNGTVIPVEASCGTPPPPTSFTLTVYKAGTGTGTVTGTNFNCGADCTESYPAGEPMSVTLTAAEATGSTFTSWSGACTTITGNTCTVTTTPTANLAVTATFTADPPPTGSCGTLPTGVVVVDTGNMTTAFAKKEYTPALPSTIYAFKMRINAGYTANSIANATKGVSSPRTKLLVVSECPGVLTGVESTGCIVTGTNVATARMSGSTGAASYYCVLPNATAKDYYINAVSKESITDTGYTCTSPSTCAFSFDRSGGG